MSNFSNRHQHCLWGECHVRATIPAGDGVPATDAVPAGTTGADLPTTTGATTDGVRTTAATAAWGDDVRGEQQQLHPGGGGGGDENVPGVSSSHAEAAG